MQIADIWTSGGSAAERSEAIFDLVVASLNVPKRRRNGQELFIRSMCLSRSRHRPPCVVYSDKEYESNRGLASAGKTGDTLGVGRSDGAEEGDTPVGQDNSGASGQGDIGADMRSRGELELSPDEVGSMDIDGESNDGDAADVFEGRGFGGDGFDGGFSVHHDGMASDVFKMPDLCADTGWFARDEHHMHGSDSGLCDLDARAEDHTSGLEAQGSSLAVEAGDGVVDMEVADDGGGNMSTGTRAPSRSTSITTTPAAASHPATTSTPASGGAAREARPPPSAWPHISPCTKKGREYAGENALLAAVGANRIKHRALFCDGPVVAVGKWMRERGGREGGRRSGGGMERERESVCVCL